MSEIIDHQGKRDLIPHIETYRGKRADDFLDFLKTLPVEVLLENRRAQAYLHLVMDRHFTRDEQYAQRVRESGRVMIMDSNPVIPLEHRSQDGWEGTTFVHNAFQLQDGEYYYYFSEGWPGDNVPPYLRLEDVIQSEMHTPTFPHDVRSRLMRELGVGEEVLDYLIYNVDRRIWDHVVPVEIPFNKPLNRVSKDGGIAERFNTVEWEWEENGDGKYTPDVKTRVKKSLGRLTCGLSKRRRRHRINFQLPPGDY